jgi:pyruvate/2-oxoglutarate dehydrogenase complex dihydrolipoamide dehydrogenase (E3) component
MTEKQVLAAGYRCARRVLPLQYVSRALVNRDTRGFIKVVADADTGRVLGLTGSPLSPAVSSSRWRTRIALAPQ